MGIGEGMSIEVADSIKAYKSNDVQSFECDIDNNLN